LTVSGVTLAQNAYHAKANGSFIQDGLGGWVAEGGG
jgi:hypothetical protein